MRRVETLILLCLLVLLPQGGRGEEPPPKPEVAGASEGAAPETETAGEGNPGTEEGEPKKEDPPFFPSLDVYFPEGDLDFRLNRMIRQVFFEGQVKYNFIEGDISAFLRYRYYGFSRTYQVAAFDAIEFEDVEDFASGDFSRVRGFLLLMEWPHDYHRRTFFLTELDRITSNRRELRFDDRRTNTFVRLGYQIGTPGDIRSNAIVGETRARREPLFTAHREIGPGGAGFTTALTYGFDMLGGDFNYVKLEFEGLKRFRLTDRHFVMGRIHGGTFPHKVVDRRKQEQEEGERLPENRYAMPRSELFRLDGRENLKGLKERLRGTEELHTTWEFFFPWFLNQQRQALKLEWQSWYWVLYAGLGTIGFDRTVYTDFDRYVPDVGVGFESSVRLNKYTFFLSGIVAQALRGEGGVEARLSVKSYR